MKKWDYLVIDSFYDQEKVSEGGKGWWRLETQLKEAGSEGWEIDKLIQRDFVRIVAVMKREITQKPTGKSSRKTKRVTKEISDDIRR